MTNYLSIDFESWTYPELPSFKSLTSIERKKLDNGYVNESAEKILELLDKHKTKLTFFIIGQLYEWYPDTIEAIEKAGHEIAYHTHTHDLLHSKEILVDTLNRSQKFLKKFKPKGFRAPTILMNDEYLKTLKEYGFSYDSSVYGEYEKYEKNGIIQIPVSKLYTIPFGSGFFTALLGKNIGKMYKKINNQRKPVVTFIHNWQIIKPKNATFPNTKYMITHPYYAPYSWEIYDTFEYLLENFRFAPMQNLIEY